MTMAAAAQQYAPRKNTQQPRAPRQQEKQPGLKDRLHALPLWAGMAAMIALLVLSLFVGNFRALQNAAPKDFLRWGDVDAIVEQRIAQAGNIVTVAERAGLDERLIFDVSNAMEQLEEAKSALEISRADQALTAAAAELTTADIFDSETRSSMQRAADNFAEQGSFLRQEGRSFNQEAVKARDLYESLPTKFLLPLPDIYEGI